MNNKWTTDLLKASFTIIFVLISYFFATIFSVGAFVSFIPKKLEIPFSIAVYTAILNFLLFFCLSFRTTIKSTVTDKSDKSNKIKISRVPRKIAIKTEILGNDMAIKGELLIIFPEWIDVTKTNDPGIKTISQSEYCYDLTNSSSTYTCYFDINLNELYLDAEREDKIKVEFKGNKLRYGKDMNHLTVHNT